MLLEQLGTIFDNVMRIFFRLLLQQFRSPQIPVSVGRGVKCSLPGVCAMEVKYPVHG